MYCTRALGRWRRRQGASALQPLVCQRAGSLWRLDGDPQRRNDQLYNWSWGISAGSNQRLGRRAAQLCEQRRRRQHLFSAPVLLFSGGHVRVYQRRVSVACSSVTHKRQPHAYAASHRASSCLPRACCAPKMFLLLTSCRSYFRGWRLTFEWTSAASNGAAQPYSSVVGFKSPLNPDDAPPALAVTYQGKTLPLLEGKPLSFDNCTSIVVELA